MGDFIQFLAEQNEIGLGFEKATAKNVNRWLSKNGMAGKFKAERFKPGRGQRSENFPDVSVSSADGNFFIECKQYSRANMLNTKFDLDEDCGAKAHDGLYSELAAQINGSDQFRRFRKFMTSGQKLLGGAKPIDVYLGKKEFDPKKIIPKYNKMVRNGLTEADCKEFDMDNLRKSTAGTVSCALSWRIAGKGTWDICRIKTDFKPYLVGKYGGGAKVKYLQLGENLFIIDSDDNPFGIDVPALPEKVTGLFTLKFTPRFGVGGVYITPRSEITDRLESPADFNNSKKWPSIKGK